MRKAVDKCGCKVEGSSDEGSPPRARWLSEIVFENNRHSSDLTLENESDLTLENEGTSCSFDRSEIKSSCSKLIENKLQYRAHALHTTPSTKS